MIEIGGPWVQTALGMVTAAAATTAAVEAYRTRRETQRNSRVLDGDEKTGWDGLVQRNKEHREALEDEEIL